MRRGKTYGITLPTGIHSQMVNSAKSEGHTLSSFIRALYQNYRRNQGAEWLEVKKPE